MPEQLQSHDYADAVAGNLRGYDSLKTAAYSSGAPHLLHDSVRNLYRSLADQIARRYPGGHVLDLGAGEGGATAEFLERGLRVTAVDLSSSQLEALKGRCAHHGANLQTIQGDVLGVLDSLVEQYDAVALISFAHHVPDYIQLLEVCARSLKPSGSILTFQDPVLWGSRGLLSHTFSRLAYFAWRIAQGDVWGGLRRHLRRKVLGVYLSNDPKDNEEYHAVRNGLDQHAMARSLEAQGFSCHIYYYFSTQGMIWQWIGERLRAENSFGLIASSERVAIARDLGGTEPQPNRVNRLE